MVTNQECPECGAAVADDAKYCSHCGTDLFETSCPNCGDRIEANLNFCPECGHELRSTPEEGTTRESEANGGEGIIEATSKEAGGVQSKTSADTGWTPAFPTVSVFMALMLIWAGVVQPPGDVFGLFLMGAGVLVLPRVRRRTVPLIREKTGVDLSWNRADWEEGPPDSMWRRPFFLTGMAYTILLLLAVIVAIMEAANEPTMTASHGIVMVALVFGLAVAVVYGARGVRRVTGV